MSYQSRFYQPYFFFKAQLPRSLAELNQRLIEQQKNQQFAHKTYELREQAKQIQAEAIAKTTYARLEAERVREQRLIQAQIQTQMHFKNENSYLERIALFRRERDLLDLMAKPGIGGTEPLRKEEREVNEEQLLKQYQTGQKAQQYQNEIRNLAKTSATIQKNEKITAKAAFSHQTENSPIKIEHFSNNNHIQKSSKPFNEAAFKRSYVDQINNSRQDSIEKQQKNNPKNSNVFLENSLLQNNNSREKFQNLIKKGKIVHNSFHSARKSSNKNAKSFIAEKKTFTQSTITSAMKRINNRVKYSAIHKDSKLRNNRHQVDHLLNTFQNELKGRKQVRDKINNHPDILKKHKLVIESR